MNLLQITTAVLFFYVFGMAAVLMTWYIVRVIRQYIQEGREQQQKKPPPDIGNENVKLHISGGLLEVNRVPDEQGK